MQTTGHISGSIDTEDPEMNATKRFQAVLSRRHHHNISSTLLYYSDKIKQITRSKHVARTRERRNSYRC
jgi:hypothetical protein